MVELNFKDDSIEGKDKINEEIFTVLEYETLGLLSFKVPENEPESEKEEVTCYDEENKYKFSQNKNKNNSNNKNDNQNEERIEIILCKRNIY